MFWLNGLIIHGENMRGVQSEGLHRYAHRFIFVCPITALDKHISWYLSMMRFDN